MPIRFFLTVVYVAFLLFVAATAQTTPALEMQRVAVPSTYTAGQAVEVTVTITKSDSRTVTALGLVETMPAGWTLEDRYAADATMRPALATATPGSVEFAYITVPVFPITFTYRMRTAATDAGEQTISGHALYRFTDAEQQTPTVTTALTAVGAPAEGEGEGEGEGEPGTTTDQGCGCAGCNSAQKFGASVGDLFLSALALMTLAGISQLRG